MIDKKIPKQHHGAKQLTKWNNRDTVWVSIDTLEEMGWLKKQKLELKVS